MPSVERRDIGYSRHLLIRRRDPLKMFQASRASWRLSGAIAARMVPQHACAVACSALVEGCSQRSLAKRPYLCALRATVGVKQSVPNPTKVSRNVPSEHFADVGGVDGAKEQIRQVVQGHLHPERYQCYDLLRNGILLYGPRGTGKTFLARATAGEFGLNFEYVSAPSLLTRWTGATSENIQAVFAHAAARKPVLFFIDEIDAVGAVRQDAMSDSGSAGRELITSLRP